MRIEHAEGLSHISLRLYNVKEQKVLLGLMYRRFLGTKENKLVSKR